MKKVMFAGAVFAAGLSVLFSGADARAAAAKKKVLMIAGRPSHGPGQHEHNAGVQLLTKSLQQGAGDLVDVSYKLNGEWPSEEELGKADTILIYSDGGGGIRRFKASGWGNWGRR